MTFEQIKQQVETAIKALKAGKSIIVLDNEDRENEGDLIFPGQLASSENVNLMLQHASGIVCLAMSKAHAKRLQLTPMVPVDLNTSQYTTPFTISIEAKEGVTTGVSAADRAHTIKVASNPNVTSDEISRPGHIFPLVANDYGVLGRQGHTEASVDLVKMAGFYPVAVLCELMNKDGTMMKGEQIERFAFEHELPILSIKALRLYRLASEKIIQKAVSTIIPFKDYGELEMAVFVDPVTNSEVKILSKNIFENPLVRIHSSCVTGDLFGSLKCDCQSQLHHALMEISKEGGILIYLDQEGRDIGLINKLKAYELQRAKKLDTVEANKALSLPVDNRRYDLAVQVLKHYNIQVCRLISNNPDKVEALKAAGINVQALVSQSVVHEHNKHYLQTKKQQFKHTIKGV
ncbi:3,4-dihydroxy-2-butanone-4-phosphate synthase [Fastidiosibacter lacustris]|uniref:3,4-dihydroxy-2-butanone-4-phosphate synthase n=1 Tax=Fastidiosibacter lacustris TaxID=2056695 RepID=UPI000E34E3BC|nr:3,4-dihydroxy-2-butanone-4-phosphate synthase [Fastidiosibacter lacustris]